MLTLSQDCLLQQSLSEDELATHKNNGCVGSTKKAGSKGEKSRTKMPTASGENYPHELFSKALRKYGHSAAIADLDALERGGNRGSAS
ncbi:hypothetical protein QTG54_009611 [Skeletonema marinoi]|uniref:Uncharacterized protein n=1 Tax=Skeletonema marinoi TaxID=267567 RepID=A0AAD8Y6C0_9STRA|nr:hypothetical protein QTG54_009611 [Skeletonema marinoi]